MKLSLILQAIDRWSGPLGKASKATAGLGKDADALKRSVGGAGGALGRFWRDAERGERVGNKLGASIRRVAERDFDRLKTSIRGASQQLSEFSRKAAVGAAKRVGAGIGYGVAGVVAGGLAAATLFGRGVIENGAKFEQYQVALESTEGSAIKARKAMDWVREFATKTPYQIDEVTDAFVRARGIGLDPMTGAFQTLGDAAGATRKSLMDAVEMLADAQTGEFERLKAFNITTSVKGQMVTFSYLDKAGKNAKISVAKNMTAIRTAILKVFNEKYSGGMERQSHTLTGIWNNLQDVATNFELAVADKGIFARVKNDLQGVYDWTEKIKKDGTLDAWASRASAQMTRLWDDAEHFIKETDWASVAQGIGAITSALVTVVGWIGKAAGAWSNWQNDVERRRLNTIINERGIWGTGIGQASPAEKNDARRRLRELDMGQYGAPQVRRGPGGVVWPEGSFSKGMPKSPWSKGTAPGQAQISLKISADRGLSVTPTRVAATGADVELDTGKTMGGFA